MVHVSMEIVFALTAAVLSGMVAAIQLITAALNLWPALARLREAIRARRRRHGHRSPSRGRRPAAPPAASGRASQPNGAPGRRRPQGRRCGRVPVVGGADPQGPTSPAQAELIPMAVVGRPVAAEMVRLMERLRAGVGSGHSSSKSAPYRARQAIRR